MTLEAGIGMGLKEELRKILNGNNEEAPAEEGDTATAVGGSLKKQP
jgi:hypothetical protein